MKTFTKQICRKTLIKLQMIHSGLAAITGMKYRIDATRRIAALITFALALSMTSINTQAHTPHDMVLALGISPNYVNDKTLFLATDGPYTGWRYPDLLRSTDGGLTWTHLPNGMDHSYQIDAIRVSPDFSNDQIVFVATPGGGIYRSTDRGDSWQNFNTGIPAWSRNIVKMETAGSGSSYSVFVVLSNGKIYRSTSTQTNWVLLSGNSNVKLIATASDSATVITADETGNLRISVNGGDNWSDLGNPAIGTIYRIAIAPGGGQEIFLATSNGVFYSNDSGVTFTSKTNNLPAGAINTLVVSPDYLNDRTVYCTSLTQAVFKSTDGGDSWTFFESGAKITNQTTATNEFSELQISSAYATDQTVFLSAFDGLFITRNGGTSWTQRQTRSNVITSLALSPNFPDDQKAIVTTYWGGGYYHSSDSGATWTVGNWPNPRKLTVFDVNFAPNPAGTPTAVSAIAGFLAISSDYGTNWDRTVIPKLPDISPSPVTTTVLAVSPDFHNDQEIFLGTRRHGVLQTLDGGKNWRGMQGVPKAANVNLTSVIVSPNYANDRTVFASNNAGEVWRTTDGGDTWSRVGASSIISIGFAKQRYTWLAVSPDFATDQLVLVGTNNGVYRSINGGDDWEPLLSTEIGPTSLIQQIEFSPGFGSDRTIYVTVRGRGLYSVTLGNDGLVASAPQNVGQWLLDRNIQFTEFRLSSGFAQDATILGAARDSIYISRDGGLAWELAAYLVP